jgi:hypothetical protein
VRNRGAGGGHKLELLARFEVEGFAAPDDKLSPEQLCEILSAAHAAGDLIEDLKAAILEERFSLKV